MKFVFEANMEKGRCYECPLCEYDYHNDCGEYYCAIDNSMVSLDVDPADCPLEEHHGIEWHPYPQEKPPRWDYFMVTLVSDAGRRLVHERLWFEEEWKAGTDWRNYTVIAWSELPKPYKEEE